MSLTKKSPKQLPLFAGAGEIHALGLLGWLGWEDALWTKPIEIELLSGQKLQIDLITIRRLQKIDTPLSVFANGAKS